MENTVRKQTGFRRYGHSRTRFRIVDPETWEDLPVGEAGMVLIGGAQVMQGYLNNPEKTEAAIREESGIRWYVSGDKGKLDKDGFLTIIDRYSRFAKVGGEMVSLSKIEKDIEDALAVEELEICATAQADEKKGERIILLTNLPLELKTLKDQLLSTGFNPLALPSEVIEVEDIPKLGSGKVDFSACKHIVESH